MVLNQAHLATVLDKYRWHYNRHQPHQSPEQRPPDVEANSPPITSLADRSVRRMPILSGLINQYQHAA